MRITAQNLVDFASRYQSDRRLPELIRRLIRATSDNIEDVFFPSGESTFRPGVDGELQAIGKAPFVPDGASVWELSTEQTPHVKGMRDFEKRSAPDAKNSYMGKSRSDITYVAVSLRRWMGEGNAGRQGFIDSAKSKAIWKDVRVVDADQLEDWLDQTPSVAAWLAREMGIISDEMQSIEHAWEDYSKGCSPALSTKLLLANRKDRAEALMQARLVPGVTRLKADSPREAAAFVHAAVLSLPDGDARRSALLAKGVVISEPASARFLTDTRNHLFVIALGRAAEVANLLAERGHTVIVPYGNSHSSSRGGDLVELPRARRHEFAEALAAMGMAEEGARAAANACHCSITVLHRTFDQAQARLPNWATPKELRKLLGPLCCGAWNHEAAADDSIVAQIADVQDYSEIEYAIQDVLVMDDAPLLRAGNLTALSAPADIWQLSIDLKVITKPLLDRFRSATLSVLGEVDPALDLPADKRAYADIYDKRRRHSGWLRRGMVEVLRLIAVNEDKFGYIPGFSAQRFVDGILTEIPGLATDYRMLASLDSLLPELAEAAPVPFLAALETLIADDGAKLSPIFEGSDDPMFSRTYYLGTLRALEVLAWDPTQIMRTTQILARLAQLDPGGRLTNRPINSLAEIFLPWDPHTNAHAALRHKALEKISQSFPDVGWTLLGKLLPDGHGISVGTAEPDWREMGASDRPVPTYASRDIDHNVAFRLAQPMAGLDSQRWLALVKAAGESHNKPVLQGLLEKIEARRAEFVSTGQSKSLWEGLRALIAKHRAFATAIWAMPPDVLDQIQKCADALQPMDLIARNRHLFSNSRIERISPNESFEQLSERSKRERAEAVAETARGGGLEAILRLAREVKTVGLLAPPVVDAMPPEFCQDVVLATFNDDALTWFASLLTSYGVSKFGLEWGKALIGSVEAREGTPLQVASLLKAWNDDQELFGFIASKSPQVQEHYWSLRDVYVRTDDVRLLAFAVTQLSTHGRNAELIEFLGGRLKETTSDVLIRVLDEALREILVNSENIRHVNRYWLGEILEELRKRADVDRTVLMGLEYHWLPGLDSYDDRRELALHDHLGESPEFFVEVLSDLYKADWEVRDTADGADDVGDDTPVDVVHETEYSADSQKRAKADIAYRVLNSWHRLPWLAADGSIDFEAMLAWSRSALALAQEKGRHSVAAREIGKLLAHVPADETDHIWPKREVRDLIEELGNEELESGLVLELFNKRGVHSRPIDGGGVQERDLAATSSQAADALLAQWPRTAGMLRENAKQWTHWADWEDRRASENRIRL